MKRKKPRTHTIICPSCKSEVGKNGVKQAKVMEAVHWGKRRIDGWFMNLRESNSWACDECLIDGKAIEGNPLKQNHAYNNPHLAYFNKGLVCDRCGDHFVFSKTEQQFWYEELQIWVFVNPKNCLTCRKEIRKGKDLNTELSELLADKDNLDREKLSRIIEIYAEMENADKMKYYQAQLRKLV